jgi:hypothetical protein
MVREVEATRERSMLGVSSEDGRQRRRQGALPGIKGRGFCRLFFSQRGTQRASALGPLVWKPRFIDSASAAFCLANSSFRIGGNQRQFASF